MNTLPSDILRREIAPSLQSRELLASRLNIPEFNEEYMSRYDDVLDEPEEIDAHVELMTSALQTLDAQTIERIVQAHEGIDNTLSDLIQRSIEALNPNLLRALNTFNEKAPRSIVGNNAVLSELYAALNDPMAPWTRSLLNVREFVTRGTDEYAVLNDNLRYLRGVLRSVVQSILE
uniref:Uncharacterized protein n=1 Tax=viral metagenome TaxID=1070528 RepID=A0A6C0BN33_9ZZZZ